VVLAERRIGSRPSGTNSAPPMPVPGWLQWLVESGGCAGRLLHFCAKSSFGVEIFIWRRCCLSSIGASITRGADAPPLVICELHLGAFEAAVTKEGDCGAGRSGGGGAATGSSPICAR